MCMGIYFSYNLYRMGRGRRFLPVKHHAAYALLSLAQSDAVCVPVAPVVLEVCVFGYIGTARIMPKYRSTEADVDR